MTYSHFYKHKLFLFKFKKKIKIRHQMAKVKKTNSSDEHAKITGITEFYD
jgi:hypothetical protein